MLSIRSPNALRPAPRRQKWHTAGNFAQHLTAMQAKDSELSRGHVEVCFSKGREVGCVRPELGLPLNSSAHACYRVKKPKLSIDWSARHLEEGPIGSLGGPVGQRSLCHRGGVEGSSPSRERPAVRLCGTYGRPTLELLGIESWVGSSHVVGTEHQPLNAANEPGIFPVPATWYATGVLKLAWHRQHGNGPDATGLIW
jgi:hypothetical protein